MTCSMVKDLALDQPLTNGPSEQGLNARTGVEVVVRHGKPHAPIGAFKVRAHAWSALRARVARTRSRTIATCAVRVCLMRPAVSARDPRETTHAVEFACLC